jgi:hypothetical protein
MTTVDFITELFCRVDDRMQDVPKHPHAHLAEKRVWPRAVRDARDRAAARRDDHEGERAGAGQPFTLCLPLALSEESSPAP